MASNEFIANVAFSRTRLLYSDKSRSDPNTLKSTNKLKLQKPMGAERLDIATDRDHAVADAVYATRQNAALKVKGTMPKGRSPVETGDLIARMKGPRALNCGELTDLACYYAMEECHDSGRVWRVSLIRPGDHAFCVVGADAPALDGSVVARLADDAGDLWVADAWMNLCCPVRQYPALAEAQCDNWTSSGKRIAWTDETGQLGWWTAKGKYSDTFARAQIRVLRSV